MLNQGATTPIFYGGAYGCFLRNNLKKVPSLPIMALVCFFFGKLAESPYTVV
jgi:hypothetical protein